MSLARWQRTIVDADGETLPGASVEVRDETTGNLAALFSDRAGTAGILNPTTADAVTALAAFYVAGGAYKIVATSGSFSNTWRHVAIGTAAELDQGDLHTFAGMRYTFASATDEEAATGTLRANNANLTGATYLYLSVTDRNSNPQGDRLADAGDSTSTIKGYVTVRKIADGTEIVYEISGAARDLRTESPTAQAIAVPVTYRSGALSPVAGDELSIELTRTGDLGNVVGLPALSANTTFYVRTDGNDSNTGLVDSAGGAFLTWQGAFNAIVATWNFNRKTVTIRAGGSGSRTFAPASGTSVLTIDPWVGAGALSIIGDTATPTNVLLSSTSADCVRLAGTSGAVIDPVTINGFEIRTTTDGYGINNQATGHLAIGTNVVFGACVDAHLAVTWRTAQIHTGAYTISGAAARHIDCDAGIIQLNAGTYTVSGTPAFSVFARFRNGGTLISDATWSGSATGQRFAGEGNALCNVAAADVDHFPGNSAGTCISGAVYEGATTLSGVQRFDFTEIASPTSPATNGLRVFAKDVSGITHLFQRDSAGTEVDITLGGGVAIKDSGLTPHENLVNAQASASAVNITADAVVLFTTDGTSKRFASLSETLNIAAAGANGLDTGSEAGDTWYHLWAIGKADGTLDGLLSASATAPTLPATYGYKGYLGAVRNDGSSNIVAFHQRGNIVAYNGTHNNALSAGAATTYTAVSLAAIVPPTARVAIGYFGVGQSSASAALIFMGVAPAGSGTADSYGEMFTQNPYGNSLNTQINATLEAYMSTPQEIMYYVGGADAVGRITINGWRF